MSFSPALAGKAGIFLFLCLIIINGIIRWKTLKKKRLFNITWDRPFFTKSTQDWKFSLCFARVVGRSGLPEDI